MEDIMVLNVYEILLKPQNCQVKNTCFHTDTDTHTHTLTRYLMVQEDQVKQAASLVSHCSVMCVFLADSENSYTLSCGVPVQPGKAPQKRNATTALPTCTGIHNGKCSIQSQVYWEKGPAVVSWSWDFTQTAALYAVRFWTDPSTDRPPDTHCQWRLALWCSSVVGFLSDDLAQKINIKLVMLVATYTAKKMNGTL